MPTIQAIPCPNCGSHAERHYLLNTQLTKTQCPICDYLMITCSISGKVVEAYSPGINLHRYEQMQLHGINVTTATAHKRHRLPIPVNSGR